MSCFKNVLRMGPYAAVLPFVHSGMEGLLPSGSSIPRLGRSIRVLVGEPLDLADLQTSAQACLLTLLGTKLFYRPGALRAHCELASGSACIA